MRIVYFMEVFWPLIGGRELLIERLMRALMDRGHEVLAIAGKHLDALPDFADLSGIPIHRFPFHQALRSRDIEQFAGVLRGVSRVQREFSPDLVHLHDFGPIALYCLRSSRAKPSRLVMTLHGCVRDFDWHEETMLPRVLRAADWVTAVSETALIQARERLPDLQHRSSTIRNGLEPPAVEPAPLPFDPPVMLCLGRLGAEKRFQIAVEAFARVIRRRPGIRMVVAGDGQVRGDLERQVEQAGLRGSVDFLGMVPPRSIWSVINRATMVLMPSRTEGFGLVALEAAVMGRPVVASLAAALPEVVLDGRTGLLFALDDVDQLAERMLRLIDHPELARRMGRAARHRALAEFDWNRSVDQYEALYRRLAGR